MALIRGTRSPSGFSYPLLEVDVVVRNASFRATALVDSGADRTVVPRVVVESLGVSYADLPSPRRPDGTPRSGLGVSGSFEIRLCRGHVRWRATTICSEFWVADMGNRALVLLGREDFFSNYFVGFNWSALSPYMEIEPAGIATG